MVLLILLALQQGPVLEEKGSEEILAGKSLALKISRGHKYLIRGTPGKLNVHDPVSLKSLAELPVPWTAFGFNPTDSTLTIVGDGISRFRTDTWKLLSNEPLKDAQFRKAEAGEKVPYFLPGQAWVTPEEDVYYRTKGGGLSMAVFREGIRAVESLSVEKVDGTAQVNGILTMLAPTLVLVDEAITAVRFKNRVYTLALSQSPIHAAPVGNHLAWVGRDMEGLYMPGTWKCVAHRQKVANTAAAVDAERGWVFAAGPEGLRAWSVNAFDAPHSLAGPGKEIRLLEVDGREGVLYTLEDAKLRRWSLKY